MSLRLIREFIKLESSAGIVLFATALLAMIIDNSPFSLYYQSFFHLNVSFSIGQFTLEKPVLHWINDGLMSLFFLLVGLEIKREMIEGELNSFSKMVLPLIAAIGGMLIPSLVYLYINWGDSVALRGWAIPTATDTAFSLAILTLLGNRIPVNLKIFLTALAIFDDIGAIVVMAIFYTTHISVLLLFCVMVLVSILMLFNHYNVRQLFAYFIVGGLLWLCVLKSGVHATMAGIILALTIPMKSTDKDKSPLHKLEHHLHPWVAFCILPIFAFANAGVSFAGITWHHVFQPIPMGIAFGLFFGKQIGIWLATMLGVRLGMSPLPRDVTPLGLYGMSLIAGVGFTMSLFIGALAFHSITVYAAFVRMGVILGSMLSGMLGYWVLRWAYPMNE